MTHLRSRNRLVAIATFLFAAPGIAGVTVCPTPVVPDVCPDEVTDVESFLPTSPNYVGPAVLCAQADIAVTVNEIPTLAAAGHCLEAYDGVEAGSAAISLPLATQTPPGQFGPSFMDVQSAGAGGSNAVTVTFHSQSSATQDAGSIGTTADYEARAWFGGGFLIQNTGVTTAEVTQSGFASNSPSSQQQFGLFGGGNTECFVSSCSIMVGDALLGTLLVSPEPPPVSALGALVPAARPARLGSIRRDAMCLVSARESGRCPVLQFVWGRARSRVCGVRAHEPARLAFLQRLRDRVGEYTARASGRR
jgi:hypothetical protein